MRKSPVIEKEKPEAQASARAFSTEAVAALREKHVMPLPGPMYSKPLQIVRGRGQFVFDEKGRKYLDAFAGVATVSIGHCHPHWLKKIDEQMREYFHTTALYLHPSLGLFAKRLSDKAKAANPDMDVCFFTNSGSEANELAAMIAKNYAGSHEFVALRHAYHGRTIMAMALTGQSAWRHSMPYPFGVSFAKANYTYRRPFGTSPKEFAAFCVEDLADVIKTSTSGKIAAFFAEPINGVGGVITPEPAYFPGAYAVIKKAGGLFIADEVQTGVGRTGNDFFGIQKWGVKPDIITMAKGLGNGYPVGAVITTRKIADAIKGKSHYNTFGGSPVQMAAAGAVLDVLESEKLPENAAKVGAHLLARLKRLEQASPYIGEARGMGLMLGVELVKDKAGKEPMPELAAKLLDMTKDRGLLIGKGGISGNVLRIKPPLCITRADADFIVDALAESLAAI
ncbi:MAG TPA: aspartate aminotransferase family protein [Elusimicrobiota bacterium]|nr:aspartate aminotransferase family protein [Elusimicrobiota bacterium]